MRKISLIFTFALIFLGVAQIKAETITEGFDNFSAGWNSGWTAWEVTLPEGWNYSGNADTFSKGTDYYKTAAPSIGVEQTNSNTYLITPELQGEFSFYLRNQTKNYQASVIAYECTYEDGTLTLGTQIGSKTLSKSSSTPTWELVTFTSSNATRVALLIARGYMDDFTYSEAEAPAGAALDVYVDGTKVAYNGALDFGVTTAGATKQFTMKNPGGADLAVTLAADGGFTLGMASATIAAKGEQVVTVTMPEATAEGTITITPAEESGLEQFLLHASGQIVPVMELYLGETAMTNGYADKFGKVAENTTHTYTVKNTGTATLNVAIASDNTEFTIEPATLEVAAGAEATFNVTFNYNAENVGARNASITLTPADTYNTALTFTATANVADPNVWSEDFEANVIPEGWESTNETYWSVSDGVAHATYGSYSTGYKLFLTTPALEVNDGDVLEFQAKSNGYSVSVKITMSKDGGDFTTCKNISLTNNMTDFETYTIEGLEAGTYQFRFANDDYELDNFEGFKLATLAHNVAITSFDIPTSGATEETYTATVTVQEKAGVEEPMWADLYIDGNKVATANKLVAANSEETLELSFIPTEGVSYKKAYIEVYNTNKDFTKKTDEVTVNITKVNVLTLSETTVNEIAAGTYDRVKINYTVRQGWNTVALPFMVNDLSVFGENVKAWTFSGYDGNLKFSRVTTGSLASATPYILYVETPTTESQLVFSNITIYSSTATEADCYTKQGDATFQGTYSNMVAGDMEGKYGVTPDGEIRVGSAKATMKAFRAYFVLPEGSEGAKLVIEGVNDDATAIDAVELFGNQDGDIYDLSGRKVSHAQKGIYIQNGKKVVIK